MKSLPELLFGPKHHTYEQIAQHEANIQFSPFKSDRRFVIFTLKAIYRGRQKGPQWAQKKEFVGYLVHWHTHHGIPIANTSRGPKLIKKADFQLSEEEFELSVLTWQEISEQNLMLQIAQIRRNNGFYFEGMKFRANNEVN